MREVLLPVLLFPVAVPMVIGAAEATRLIFQPNPFFGPWGWDSFVGRLRRRLRRRVLAYVRVRSRGIDRAMTRRAT